MSYEDFDVEALLEKKLVENFDTALDVVIKNKQNFGIVIDGTQGTAKTTNACIISKYFQSNFDVESQVGRGIDQFIKSYNFTIDKVKVKSVGGLKVKVVVYDEANDSDRGASRGRVQRILNQVLMASSRQEVIILIIVLHRFYRLDEKFFDNALVDMLINFDYKVNDKYAHFRVYDIDSCLWMLSQIKRGKVAKKPLVYGVSSPNFMGRIKAPPVDFMFEVEKFSKEGKDLVRKKGTREILSTNYYTVSVVASMLGQTKGSVEYRIKKLGLSKLYLREKSGRTLFYDKDLFAVLKKVYSKEEDDLQKLKETK